jgi:hypothetical protein
MEVRDAVESDAEALSAIADAPADVMRNVIHDRTVRIAERQRPETDPNVDTDVEEREVLGFVSFDAQAETVHVTQLGGSVEACKRLLGEPVRFAAGEGMSVELLVPADDDVGRDAADRAGFSRAGSGPMFQGTPTVRYRLQPS